MRSVAYGTARRAGPKLLQNRLQSLRAVLLNHGRLESSEGEVIKAMALNRAIEIPFEALTPKTTRMRVVANSNGVFKDSATATEIIIQTERVLPAT